MTATGSPADRARAEPATENVAVWRGTADRLRARFAMRWSDPEWRVDVALAACSLFLGLFSVVTLVAVGTLSHSKLPLFDAWEHWNRYLSSGWSMTFLFSQHTEHRIPVSSPPYLADERWFRGETRFLLACTLLAQCGSAVMLYRLACSAPHLSRARRLYVLGLILALAFSASQWVNFTWTFQVCFVVVFFAAIAAFVCLKNSVRRRHPHESAVSARWLAAAIVMGLIATGSMANGLFVWPLLVMMAACLGLPRKVSGLLAVVGIGVIFAYMYGYQNRAGIDFSRSWARAPEVVVFALTYLGSALDEPLVAATKAVGLDWDAYRVLLSALAGFLGLLACLDLAIVTLRERSRQTPAAIAMLHVLAFLAASSAVTAVGRVQFPMKDALTTRYATPSLLFWATLVALVFSSPAAANRSSTTAGGYRLRVAALLAAAFIGGLVQLPKVAYAIDSERYLSEGEYALINNVFVPEGWERFIGSGSAASMIPVVRYFRQQRLAAFRPEWTRWIGDSALAHFRITSSDDDCIGAWESVSGAGGSFNPAALVSGWGYDRRFKRAPERIVFVDGTRRIAGFATTTRRRPELALAHPEFSTEHVGWASFVPAGLASDLTAYAVLGDGRSLCRLGGAHIPGGYLTAPVAKAGETIPGVEASAQGAWIKNGPPIGAAAPPFATDTWRSPTPGSGSGVLRLGPVKATGGLSIGLPLITGAAASAVRVSAIERGTGEVLAATQPPPSTSAWDLWRLDLPPGSPEMIVDYVIEPGGSKPDDWVVVGLPRLIRR